MNQNQYLRILQDVLDSAEIEKYIGYSKFDALESPVVRALSCNWWLFRLLWTQFVMRSPINVRPFLGVRKGVNPKGVALFARANLTSYEIERDDHQAARARWLLDWLLDHDSRSRGNYHGSCWGYHHAWQSPGFYAPEYYPNCVVTVFAAEALLHGYRVLEDKRYLEAARSAADFILNDLTVFFEDADQKCIAYVPGIPRQFVVINNNALAGALLAKTGCITGENHLLDQAKKLIEFVVRNRTPYDAWYYTVNRKQTLITHDNYHTGGILDALAEYAQVTGDEKHSRIYKNGLRYYRENLFLEDGSPKWMNNRIYPKDIHGSAQGIISFARAGDLSFASRIADWTIRNLYKGNGNFAYQKEHFFTKRFTLMRWCNSWMAYALSFLHLRSLPG
jgi:hypothetical protein